MRRSAEVCDWRGWVLVGWVGVVGALYASMLVERKAPAATAKVRAWLGPRAGFPFLGG